MEDIFVVRQQGGLTDDELRAALEQSLQGRNLRRVLIIPPDFTRFHSQAGKITWGECNSIRLDSSWESSLYFPLVLHI